MPRSLLALPILLIPAAAPAQEGPSFDCRDASTRTEVAICANPDLSRLEMRMFEAYEGLVRAIGTGEARRIADDLLVRRQACEGDPGCIAERLLISMEVFNQRAGRTGDFARLEDLLRPDLLQGEAALAEPPAVPPVAAAPGSDLPLAAQAPWPSDGLPPSRDLTDAIDEAELASSDNAGAELPEEAADADAQAPFDAPLSWAFMDLTREERIAIQERLSEVGFLEGEAGGAWTNGTLAALERLAEEEGSGSFDLTSQAGAALLLDYVASGAFATAFGLAEGETAATPAASAPVAPTSDDPLSGSDW